MGQPSQAPRPAPAAPPVAPAAFEDSQPDFQRQSGSALDAKMKAKELQSQIRYELKRLDREIRNKQKDESKCLQKMAKAQGEAEALELARTVVQSRKSVVRINHCKHSLETHHEQLNSSFAVMSTKDLLKMSSDASRREI